MVAQARHHTYVPNEPRIIVGFCTKRIINVRITELRTHVQRERHAKSKSVGVLMRTYLMAGDFKRVRVGKRVNADSYVSSL